jgi:acetyl-CoA C-acetyltransferase
MKAVMFGAQSIMLGQQNVVISGGFESMSNIPHYLMKARQGYGYGHGELIDGCIKDGLWDAFDNQHMGNAGEVCATEYSFSRAEQDAYCIETFRRAQESIANGSFKREIVPVTITDKRGANTVVDTDEEPGKLKADKVPSLRPAFKKDGTVTAANASNINDGASALVLVSGAYARKHNLKPIARIRGFADAQKKPVEFTTAPSVAIPRAMKAAGVSASDVSYYEINEAFSVVALANIKILNLDPSRVNAFGGSVALGHPLGSSGSRIIVTLLNVLNSKQGTIGVAGICNGGGGASAIVVERL